jgi:uncharacterized glyoxalase superfamily protein PhnB
VDADGRTRVRAREDHGIVRGWYRPDGPKEALTMASSKAGKKTKAKVQPKAKAKTMARPAVKPAAKKAAAKAPAAKAPAAKPVVRKDIPAPKPSTSGLSLKSAGPSFTVDNVEKSLAWYRDVLGFTVGQRWEEKGALLGVELNAGNVTFMISQDDWSKGKHRIKGGGFRIYCETDQDVDRIAEGIKSRGGTLLQEPTDAEWGRNFAVQDPDGFKISISKTR